MSGATPTACPSCGSAADTAYCGTCGERLLGHHELSPAGQLEQVFHGLFHLDGRFWRSFWYLLARPGFLAVEYCRGARVNYMKPVQILLIANLVYFLLQPLTIHNTFTSTLELQLQSQFYSIPLRRSVEARLADRGESLAHYVEHSGESFDRRMSTLARSLLLVLIPVFAALLALLDRKHRRTFGEHLVLATHHLAFQLAFLYLPMLVVVGALAQRGWLPAFELEFSVILMLIDLTWWTVALRRFYEDRPLSAVGKAAILTIALGPIVMLYRLPLFWLTFWTTPIHTSAVPTLPTATALHLTSESKSPASDLSRGTVDPPYQADWPDRTHEVVVYVNELMDEPTESYRLGKQGDPALPGVTITVTNETIAPDDDLRVIVSKADGYNSLTVELKTVRREKRLLARVWAEGHVFPQAAPEWLDVSGQASINTWIWPEVKPFVIDYTLYGVRGGIRHSVSDRVIIDF